MYSSGIDADAVAAVPVDGGDVNLNNVKIGLLPGSYTLSSTINIPTGSNIQIEGASGATILNISTGTAISSPANASVNVKISNIIIDYGNNSGAEAIGLSDLSTTDANIYLSNVTVRNGGSGTSFGALGGTYVYANNLQAISLAGGLNLDGNGKHILDGYYYYAGAGSDNALAVLPGTSSTPVAFYDISNVMIDGNTGTPIADAFIIAGSTAATSDTTVMCNVNNIIVLNWGAKSPFSIDSQSSYLIKGITVHNLTINNCSSIGLNSCADWEISGFNLFLTASSGGFTLYSGTTYGIISSGSIYNPSGNGAALNLGGCTHITLQNIKLQGTFNFGVTTSTSPLSTYMDIVGIDITGATFGIVGINAGNFDSTSSIRDCPGFSVPTSISANPPVSGTVYQNTNPTAIRLKIPVTYSPTSTAAATLATGTSSSSTVTTSTKVSYPAGITTGIIDTYEMVVPAGQYFELVATNATIGTAEVQAA